MTHVLILFHRPNVVTPCSAPKCRNLNLCICPWLRRSRLAHQGIALGAITGAPRDRTQHSQFADRISSEQY